MAIFHFTVKIVGRSKGKSIIAASAYLNGDVMKNEETGKVSYYTSKKEVVYTSLMMCENAPLEWTNVPDENIKRFRKSIRYQRAEDKEAALEKFKITFQKQRLWNEVLKVEKGANAQFGRSFEFSLPKEWSRMEQIEYATDFIQRNFVAKGMCADWSIHDKGDGNPHVHLLVTMRPFKKNHTWGNKEIKDWAFVRDEAGNIVIDETHPNWWQDKKTPERHGIRIPVLDADGNQKLDSRNRKQWKRGVTDATGWNNPKNCELWRSEWAKECNLHLKKEQQIDHRSYERQEKIEIPTIHEGADARKIEERYQSGQAVSASWKVERNRIIKKQNKILKKLQEVFGQVGILLKQWKERLNDIRRKQRSYSSDGEYDKSDRGPTGTYGRDVPGDGAAGRTTQFVSGAESKREKLVKYKVALQPNKQPIIWRTLCETIENDFAGDIRKLFSDNGYSVQKIKEFIARNKKKFPYLGGNKICNYWLYVMEQYTDVTFVDRENITVAPDTHVIQASERLGIISSEEAGQGNVQEIVAQRWQEILKGTDLVPIDVHTPMWLWSRGKFVVQI